MNSLASPDSTVAELMLGIGLSSAFVAGAVASRSMTEQRGRSVPSLTLACFAAIASVSLVQLAFEPSLLPLLMRRGTASASGQPWRLLTSLLVQDGGWPGFAFNLAGLLAVGTVAERLLGRARWAAVAVVSVVAAQLAGLAWQPLGAGNSILDFGLAGAVCAACLTMSEARHPPLVPIVAASICFVGLAAARDVHGVAALAGALTAAALRAVGARGNPRDRTVREG